MKKILFVINSLKRRGAEQQLFNFISAIHKQFDVDVFTFSTNKKDYPQFFTIPGVNIFLCNYPGMYNILKLWQLYIQMKRGAYDLIVTVGLGAALFGGRLSALLNKAPAVYSQLNTFDNFNNLPQFKNNYFDVLNKCLNTVIENYPGKSIYRLLPNSNKLSEKIKGQISNYQVQTFYNGFPIEEFRRVEEYMPSHGIALNSSPTETSPTIIQVGALDRNKNPMFTLKCLPIILERFDNLRLIFIGEGPEKKKMKRWVNDNNFNSSVIFAGQMDRMDCLYMMSKADLLVLTSESESFPNVLVEAHALGIPAVTLSVGASSEIVISGKTGYIVSENNHQRFSGCIIDILGDEKKKLKMGIAAKSWVLKKFSMDQKVKRFITMTQSDLNLS